MMLFLRRFSSLRWKLVFSYVVVTLLTILILEGIVILAARWLDLRFAAEWDSRSAGRLGSSLLMTTLALLPCMIPLGLLFGFVTTVGLTGRLRRLSEASSSLAAGDLSCRVHDTSGDEIGQLARQFDAMAGQLEDDTNQLRELAERNARLAMQAQRGAALEERHRLARDLHDGVKQHLFGANLATSAALNLIDSDPESARARLLEAKDHSRQAQAEMQALLNELRPAGLDDRGLVAALEDFVAGFGRAEGIEVEWWADDDLELPMTHQQALYRVAQEALTNVARHAEADRVSVSLRENGDAVVLEVVDDGRGFDSVLTYAGNSMGLQGMKERLAVISGTLDVESAPGEGTRVIARVIPPMEKAPDG